jgi:hypothetical protein
MNSGQYCHLRPLLKNTLLHTSGGEGPTSTDAILGAMMMIDVRCGEEIECYH